jgi:hypothetical protein
MTNVNPNPRTSLSQTRAILSYMRQGRAITPSEARRLYGSDRLGARIMDIEKIVGYKLPRKMVEVSGMDASGHAVKKRVMSYWLRAEDVVQ